MTEARSEADSENGDTLAQSFPSCIHYPTPADNESIERDRKRTSRNCLATFVLDRPGIVTTVAIELGAVRAAGIARWCRADLGPT